MKSILLHDEEWNFFLDALQLTSQPNIEYQSAEGFRLDSIKSLLFSNNATSFLNLMTVLNMYGLQQNQLQISPGDVAEYTYNVFFYKGVANGKTVYMCPMLLLPESVVEDATESSSTKVNGDYIVAAAGIEIIGAQEFRTSGQLQTDTYRLSGTYISGNQQYSLVGTTVNALDPIPIKSYRNGVVEFDQTKFPTTSESVIRVTIKRIINDYKKGDFSKTPLGEVAPVTVTKNALPILSFEHSWFFSALIGGTQELPWEGSSSPLLVSLQGNDTYIAYLTSVSTLSGDGISLPDADREGKVYGTAPGTLKIAYGTNQAATTNTALLVINTTHCGIFTFNLFN